MILSLGIPAAPQISSQPANNFDYSSAEVLFRSSSLRSSRLCGLKSASQFFAACEQFGLLQCRAAQPQPRSDRRDAQLRTRTRTRTSEARIFRQAEEPRNTRNTRKDGLQGAPFQRGPCIPRLSFVVFGCGFAALYSSRLYCSFACPLLRTLLLGKPLRWFQPALGP